MGYQSGFYQCDKHHVLKQLKEERIYFQVQLPHHKPALKETRAGAQGSHPEAGTEVTTMEERCLLLCSLWCLSCFPTSIINLENAPQAWLWATLLGHFSADVLAPT